MFLKWLDFALPMLPRELKKKKLKTKIHINVSKVSVLIN